jgi:2-iminobutanoate/2-iminopropanoate deaminase
MPKQYLNPSELFPSQRYGFSQIVTSQGGKTVYLSGQVAWENEGNIVGPDDLHAQTVQALPNIEIALKSAGASITDIVSMRIYIVESKLAEDRHITEALKTFFPTDRLPASTWVGVPALSNKDFLVEIEAVAMIE